MPYNPTHIDIVKEAVVRSLPVAANIVQSIPETLVQPEKAIAAMIAAVIITKEAGYVGRGEFCEMAALLYDTIQIQKIQRAKGSLQ